MIYLDNAATTLHKPPEVYRAIRQAMLRCGNPGRGGHPAAMAAAETVYRCREEAAKLFDCHSEQVVFTANCTHGLNLAIHSMVEPGSRVAVTGFEHNAVMRPLYERKVTPVIAGRKLFDWADTLQRWEDALKSGVSAAVFTHCSNVFGYVLPVEQMAELCHRYGVPFIVDAAQSAGSLPVSLKKWGADYIAMPGHKGLLGPQGTGILLCSRSGKPLLQGGTGSQSESRQMPEHLPDAYEAGTLNVPGIAGLHAGLRRVQKEGLDRIFARESAAARRCAKALQMLGYTVFSGENQGGVVSFAGKSDCEELSSHMASRGLMARAGLHCAPLAHESAGTLKTGTVRLSFGWDTDNFQIQEAVQILKRLDRKKQEKRQ